MVVPIAKFIVLKASKLPREEVGRCMLTTVKIREEDVWFQLLKL